MWTDEQVRDTTSTIKGGEASIVFVPGKGAERRWQPQTAAFQRIQWCYGEVWLPWCIFGKPSTILTAEDSTGNRNPSYKGAPSHTLLPGGALKRRRSPSPVNYQQYGAYKPATSQASYQKVDDNRRGHECGRAVLRDKPYGLAESSQNGRFYSTSTTLNYSAAPAPSQTIYR